MSKIQLEAKKKREEKIITLKKNEEFIGITLNNSRRNVFVIRENTLTPPHPPVLEHELTEREWKVPA